MAEEIITQTTEEIAAQNNDTRSQQRITQLSEKVELTSKERDEMKELVGKKDIEISELQREKSFSDGFADILGTHTAAREHKDEIKAKVLAGYSVEDATYAVLGKAGKLNNVVPVQTQVAGGSAATNVSTTQKSVSEMTTDEKRAQLEKELILT